MNHDLQQACAILHQGNVTCVLCRENTIRTGTSRGVAPLLDFLNEGSWSGFSAADKVVGKATAFLYVLMGVRAVYAPVMSTAAIRVLNAHGIECSYDTETEAVFNRTRTGFCPMETAVREIEDPHQALTAIRATLAELARKPL